MATLNEISALLDVASNSGQYAAVIGCQSFPATVRHMAHEASFGRNIREARERARMTQEQLGAKLVPPASKQTIYKYETDKVHAPYAAAAQIARILNMPLADVRPRTQDIFTQQPGILLWGHARAGYWAEPSHAPEPHELPTVPIVPSPKYPTADQYALGVDGPSINRVAQDGAYVHCVRLSAYPCDDEFRALDGKLVHVERTRGDLVETTIKRLKHGPKGLELWPDSSDPKHQAMLRLDGDSIEIKGVVIGKYEPLE